MHRASLVQDSSFPGHLSNTICPAEARHLLANGERPHSIFAEATHLHFLGIVEPHPLARNTERSDLIENPLDGRPPHLHDWRSTCLLALTVQNEPSRRTILLTASGGPYHEAAEIWSRHPHYSGALLNTLAISWRGTSVCLLVDIVLSLQTL